MQTLNIIVLLSDWPIGLCPPAAFCLFFFIFLARDSKEADRSGPVP